jgi:hydrogenase maturation protease
VGRPARVIGVGSPHGDDSIGWKLVDRLRGRTTADLVCLRQPVDVVEYLADVSLVILVDACLSGRPAGTVTRLVWPDRRIEQRHGRSTHGLAIASALQLAETLGRVPRRIVVYGVEMAAACRPLADCGAAAQHALEQLDAQVLDELARWAVLSTDSTSFPGEGILS